MIGNEIITGNSTQKIDNKHRIILPNFTNAEEGEKLVLYEEFDFISIYSQSKFEEKFISKEPKSPIEQKKEYDELAKKILGTTEVKSQNRIVIPKEVIIQYKLLKEIIIQGAIDHINLYGKNEEPQNKKTRKRRG